MLAAWSLPAASECHWPQRCTDVSHCWRDLRWRLKLYIALHRKPTSEPTERHLGLGLLWGVFTCVGWQVTWCDTIRHFYFNFTLISTSWCLVLTAVQHAVQTLTYLTCRCTSTWLEKNVSINKSGAGRRQVCSWHFASHFADVHFAGVPTTVL